MSPEINIPYILMMEDDAEDRYITRSFFEEKGYNIGLEFVTHPDGVIGFLDERRKNSGQLPRIILLDKHVPAGDGVDVLQQLKEHPDYKQIPVIIVSGTAAPEDVKRSYELNVSSYIVKPMTDKLTTEKIDAFVQYWFNTVELPA